MTAEDRYRKISMVINSLTYEENYAYLNEWKNIHKHVKTPKMKYWERSVLNGIVSDLVKLVEKKLKLRITSKEKKFIESLYSKFLVTYHLLDSSKNLDW